MQCKAGDRASVATDQRGPRTRHTFSSFETRRPPLCRSTTHGYVRLFRYADDPAERATGTRNIPRGSTDGGRMGGEICSNDGKSLSFETMNNFLLNSLSAPRKLAIKLSGKIEKHREGVDFPPLERYPFPAEGSHCWPGICMSTHFPTRVRGMEGRSRSAMPPPSGGMLIFRAYARRTPPFHRRVSSTPTSTDPPSSISAPIFFVIYRPLARRSFTYRSEPLLLPLSLYPLPSDTRVN